MRPRGRTPRMLRPHVLVAAQQQGFNEAAGAYPADALDDNADGEWRIAQLQ